MRWACLSIFFLDLGLGEVLLWGRLEPAFGGNRRRVFSGWSVQQKGAGALAAGQTLLRYTTSAPPSPPPGVSTQALPCCSLFREKLWRLMMDVHRDDAGGGTRSARRRREATSARFCATSDGPVRVQAPLLKRTEGERFELNHTAKSRKHLSSRAVPSHPVWVCRGATGAVGAALLGAHGGHLPLRADS